MIYKARSETRFVVSRLIIGDDVIMLESINNNVTFDAYIGKGKRTRYIDLGILQSPVSHEPRVKVFPSGKNIVLMSYPIDRHTGEINGKIEEDMKASKEIRLDSKEKKELRDLVQDFSMSCIDEIMLFYNQNSTNKTRDIIDSKLSELLDCDTPSDRKNIVKKFIEGRNK